MQAPPPLQPGQQPTPQQIQMIQQQFLAEASRQGLTPQQFGEKLKAMQQQRMQAQGQAPGQAPPPGGGPTPQQIQQMQQAQQQQQLQQQQQQQQVPIQPGAPKPEAIAVAKFLRSQNLKSRACIFQEKRKELFKVKRAIRALQSPAYTKASSKNLLLPPVTDRLSAENAFKLLPLSMLAIRVSKLDPNASSNIPHGQPGHTHQSSKTPKTKDGKRGLWIVKVEQQQEAVDAYHYIWFYDGPQWRQKVYAGLALLAVVAVVLFPLWPLFLRKGVWYLSMTALGLLGAFFGLAIVRLIVFLVTIVAVQPGIWIYPNLFEDVGFFDSFKPSWAWRETKETLAAKKAAKKTKKQQKKDKGAATLPNGDATLITDVSKTSASNGTTGAEPVPGTGTIASRKAFQTARIEEIAD